MYKVKKIFWPALSAFDLFGHIIFFWKKLKKQPTTIKKVLFIRLEHIGDMIMATPTFETFKINHPDTEMHVLCKNLTAPLIRYNPKIDKIITYDAPWFTKRMEDKNKKLKDIIKELKNEKYDFVFEMHGDPRNNYLASKIGGYSIGYSCRGGGFFLNKTMKYDENKHMIKQNLTLISDFCKKTHDKMRLYTDQKAKNNAKVIIKNYGLKERKFIIINPISGRPEKDLTDKEVINFINKHKKTTIVITGGRSENQYNQLYERYSNIVNLSGKTDLLTLIEIVKVAKKVIAPDTGIIHIAKAVNTPFEAIYKTTNKKIWGYQ